MHIKRISQPTLHYNKITIHACLKTLKRKIVGILMPLFVDVYYFEKCKNMEWINNARMSKHIRLAKQNASL